MMSANKLQDAITLIKSGDKQNGQRLLTEILKSDPKNETAWLWMASLVTGDKRKFCLEKVLNINPNNPHALQQMAKMSSVQSPQIQNPVQAPAPILPAVPENRVTESVLQPPNTSTTYGDTPSREILGDQFWLTPGKHLATIVYISGDTLLAFDVLPDLAPQVINEIRGGATQKQLHDEKGKYHLQSICYVPFSRITKVMLFSDDITVFSVHGSGEEKKNGITCNKENSEAILTAIEKRLAPGFQKTTKPISRGRVLVSGAIASAVVLCGSGFFYWFIQGLAAEGGGTSGSPRARGIATLLLLIGPNGVLCIGGVLMLLVLLGLISSLAKPPEETTLARTLG